MCYTLNVFPDLLKLQQTHPQRYPHLLESVAHGTPQARYDILFAFPEHTLSLLAGSRIVRDGRLAGVGDFLAAFEHLWSEHASAAACVRNMPTMQGINLPFTGGWFVYFGYELAAQIESKLKHIPVVPDLPLASITRIPAAIIRDHVTGLTHLLCESNRADALIGEMQCDVRRQATRTEAAVEVVQLHEDAPSIFLNGVERTLDYIRAGDVFQVNLSRSWEATLSKPVAAAALYDRLRRTNPAPFAGLMTLDENTAVISSSPERLVNVTGDLIRTRPIAGTYPRSDDRQQDERWSQELLRHPKERAEHVMLIDLERNDLGRVCRVGTVEVNELMVLESYRHVHHIVSEVSGTLREEVTPAQVIRAVFPGGTITGCPKVRCMEIIAELEGTARGPYTGSMGYINRDGSMDLNILIRTMVLQAHHVRLRAGAGIVADSKPRRELHETRAKAKGMLAALGYG
ncbi:MAG: aminodeoxychorismate synthase component I [Acidiferrobacterales bacterium]